jgi:hypothetical protein
MPLSERTLKLIAGAQRMIQMKMEPGLIPTIPTAQTVQLHNRLDQGQQALAAVLKAQSSSAQADPLSQSSPSNVV